MDVEVLIERWQGGDERAAEGLYNLYRVGVFRLAYLLLGDTADAEEVAQDALTYALVNIDRYDERRASFKGWVHMLTVSRCRDKRRRKWLPSLSLGAWLGMGRDVADERPLPEQATTKKEAMGEVWAAVQQLNQKQREAILLRHWAGHSYVEMGEILGCSTRTAQSRVRLAHENLRGMLKREVLFGVEEEWR